MSAAWLALGSNLGDREAAIRGAVAQLDGVTGIAVRAMSRLYRTEPWGDLDQGEFLNAAVAIETALAPHALLDVCLAIEDALGRVRERRWGPRSIDVDVLHYEGVRIAGPRLTLPHPLWRERAFVLVPLSEIAPDLVVDDIRVADAAAAVDRSTVAALTDEAP